ncbi:hypothetical protein LWI29_007184 [Acer saccharum]|uniref:Uncharacterized protein n=1 Tax=Acer saccharum TaxID=4024 RepID=A0AA39RKK1_ACESA|nr:hypothetical protein LWI29_007184 [Acer saccharum]
MTDPQDSSSTNPAPNSQGSNNLFSAQGPNDPFFVHHSDNPTAVLVSPKLSEDNYNTGSLTGIAPQANLTDVDRYGRKDGRCGYCDLKFRGFGDG